MDFYLASIPLQKNMTLADESALSTLGKMLSSRVTISPVTAVAGHSQSLETASRVKGQFPAETWNRFT